jgi:rhodanese-related sulfurtransferase
MGRWPAYLKLTESCGNDSHELFSRGEKQVQMTSSSTVAELVADARRHIENLSPEQVEAELASSDVLLVDIREPDEQAQTGTIAGAVRAPRGMLEFYADAATAYYRPEFEPRRRTILYCASGGRSALAVESLMRLGYSNVAHLGGGLKAWTSSGREVSHA